MASRFKKQNFPMNDTRTELRRIAERTGHTLGDVLELWTERSAHREYDAGETRENAERLALLDVAAMLG